ncbi:MAG TPA: P-type conjugative transfer protein TrbJ [Beijerinckiaceae bacterium]|nr:P-type conjugative transfer protein TrbJ [Beijerinckiaceae bacterium]
MTSSERYGLKKHVIDNRPADDRGLKLLLSNVARRTARRRFCAALAALALLSSIPARADGLVFDPWNYSQNVLTAARTLQQIDNQITALQNQAQMLVNQARNLASLPTSSLQAIQQSMAQTQQLLGQAQRIAYDVTQIDQAFSTQYGAASPSASDQALIAGAQTRWQNSMAGFQDALRVQAGVVQDLAVTRAQTSALVSASQSAQGALQASQAGDQLLALQSTQLADLTALLASQGRAQSLEMARHAEAQEQGRALLQTFLTPGAGYQPNAIAMFHN